MHLSNQRASFMQMPRALSIRDNLTHTAMTLLTVFGIIGKV